MNKTAFITGANKGIGFGISKHLGLDNGEFIELYPIVKED